MIQYYHQTRHLYGPKYTFAVLPPHPDNIIALAHPNNMGNSIQISVGLARCNPLDQYVKSIGRSVAFQDLQAKEFRLQSVNHFQEEEQTLVTLTSKEYTLVFKLFPNCGKVHFIRGSLK
jgi:hypothetical protein